VDCSKIYINMCEKAREIQSSKREHGDLIVLKGQEYLVGYWVSGYWDSDNPTFYGARCIFLPRQDQLQGKLGDNIIAWCSLFFEWIVESLEPIGIYASDEFDSMEQLWLAFVMLELYNKKWDGTKWIK